jgi:hypothetical protein
MNVAKVDLYVAYVARVIHVCCIHLLQMFHQLSSNACCIFNVERVLVVLEVCCKCSILMLQVLTPKIGRTGRDRFYHPT